MLSLGSVADELFLLLSPPAVAFDSYVRRFHLSSDAFARFLQNERHPKQKRAM